MGSIAVRSDTYTAEAAPDTSYESQIDLQVYSSSGANKRAYIEFSLDDLPRPYCNLTTLDFYLFPDSWGAPAATLDFNWLAGHDWDDSAVTWNNSPASGVTDYTHTSSANIIQLNLLNYLAYLNAYYSYIGYEIKYDVEDAVGFNEYKSSECTAPSLRPYLQYASSAWTMQVNSDAMSYDPAKELSPWWKGHAKEVYYADHDVGFTEFELDVILPWNAFGSGYTTITALPYQTWSSTYENGALRYRIQVYFATSGENPTVRYHEQYWTTGDLYVKTDGDDSLNGRSWTNAFKTITQAADQAQDWQTVRIGFGEYADETDITPDNVGTLGIKYLPETADTGGGTGSVIINM